MLVIFAMPGLRYGTRILSGHGSTCFLLSSCDWLAEYVFVSFPLMSSVNGSVTRKGSNEYCSRLQEVDLDQFHLIYMVLIPGDDPCTWFTLSSVRAAVGPHVIL